VLASGHAAAQFKDAEDATEYRQGALHVLGNHFGRIGAMVTGKAPFDAKAVQINADIASTMIKLPWAAFIDGSDKGETAAKPEIWSQADKFKAAALKAMDKVAELDAAAKTGDQEKIKAAFGAAGQACKGCHDDFRKKK
jgi:cytochrome c556